MEGRTGVLRHPQDHEPRRGRRRLPRRRPEEITTTSRRTFCIATVTPARADGSASTPPNSTSITWCSDRTGAVTSRRTWSPSVRRATTTCTPGSSHSREPGPGRSTPPRSASSRGPSCGSAWLFATTFGYETKFKREQCLGWPKSHAADAVAICCEDGEVVTPSPTVVPQAARGEGGLSADQRQTEREADTDREVVRPAKVRSGLDCREASGSSRASGRAATSRSQRSTAPRFTTVPRQRIATRISARSTTLIEERLKPWKSVSSTGTKVRWYPRAKAQN